MGHGENTSPHDIMEYEFIIKCPHFRVLERMNRAYRRDRFHKRCWRSPCRDARVLIFFVPVFHGRSLNTCLL
jgi:hypothetical protein